MKLGTHSSNTPQMLVPPGTGPLLSGQSFSTWMHLSGYGIWIHAIRASSMRFRYMCYCIETCMCARVRVCICVCRLRRMVSFILQSWPWVRMAMHYLTSPTLLLLWEAGNIPHDLVFSAEVVFSLRKITPIMANEMAKVLYKMEDLCYPILVYLILSFLPSIHSSIHQSFLLTHSSTSYPTHSPSIHLPIYPSSYPPTHLSTYPFTHLSTHISIHALTHHLPMI